jgi:hypothetical protein
MTTITHNIRDDLNAILPEYQKLSGLTDADVLSKQGGKLGFAVYKELRSTMPVKGSIREKLVARLHDGRGIKIRDSVRESVAAKYASKTKAGKTRRFKLNIEQEMVRREIAVREGGRGVLSISIKYPKTISDQQKSISRYSQLLSQVGIHLDAENRYAQFLWPGISRQSKSVVGGINRPIGQEAIDRAAKTVLEDIKTYTTRKHAEALAVTTKRMVK